MSRLFGREQTTTLKSKLGMLKCCLRLLSNKFFRKPLIISVTCFDSGKSHSMTRRFIHSNNMSSGGPMFCLNDYDVIGFDLDHTLCKYNLKAISQLIYSIMTNYLVNKRNYDREMFGSYETAVAFYQKGLIIDMKRGNFLKLAEDITILRATHGSRVLTAEEIRKTYGPERIWEPTKDILFGLCEEKAHTKPYRSLLDYFVIPAPYICAIIIDNLDIKSGNISEEYTFWMDVYDSISAMYRREGFHNNEGGYFSALRENISLYTEKCSPEVLQWLKNLKSHKKVFLLTGSHYDYAEFILNYIIGEDWRDYFDIYITYARKPNIMYENSPFLLLDGYRETVPADQLLANQVYSQGNWTQFKEFFSSACNKTDPKFLYFGDMLTDDVYAGNHFNCFDGVAVIEEMAAEGMSGYESSSDLNELKSEIWGSFFVDTDAAGIAKRPFWSSTAMKYGQLAIPCLNVMSSLSLDEKIHSFNFNNSTNLGGFYPGLPHVLRLTSKI